MRLKDKLDRLFAAYRQILLLAITRFLLFLGSNSYSLFIPAYFLRKGLSLRDVSWLLVGLGVGRIVSAYFGKKMLEKYGGKPLMLQRCIVEPLFIAALNSYDRLRLPLFIYGFWGEAFTSLFWMGGEKFTINSTKKANRATVVGALISVQTLANVIGPFLGGLIITSFGYGWLFAFAIFCLLLMSLPALMLKEGAVEIKKEAIKFPTNLSLIYVVVGMLITLSVFIWPLFIFQKLKSELSLGAIASITAAIVVAANIVSGRIADKRGRRFGIGLGMLLHAPLTLLMSLAGGFYQFVIIDCLEKIFTTIWDGPLFALYADRVQHKNLGDAITKRITAVGTGQLIIGLVFMFLGYNPAFYLCGYGLLISAFLSTTLRNTGRRQNA